MKTVHDRFHQPQRSEHLVDIQLAKFNDRLKTSRRYRVFESGNGIYQVELPDTGCKYVVNLKDNSCDCTDFEQYNSPCAYAITACRYATEDPYSYVDERYSVEVYRRTYEHFILPMNIENLVSEQGILPPVFKKQRGRPKTKRIRKDAYKRKATHCGNCGGINHNRRSCRSAPAYNGRQQRARDRELSISSGSSSSSSNSDLGLDLDLNSWHLQDAQFRAEIEHYETVIARATEVYKGNSRNSIENDSNSELSSIASSLFNSMEGIEVGGESSGGMEGIEMGGTDKINVSQYRRVLRSKTK